MKQKFDLEIDEEFFDNFLYYLELLENDDSDKYQIIEKLRDLIYSFFSNDDGFYHASTFDRLYQDIYAKTQEIIKLKALNTEYQGILDSNLVEALETA